MQLDVTIRHTEHTIYAFKRGEPLPKHVLTNPGIVQLLQDGTLLVCNYVSDCPDIMHAEIYVAYTGNQDKIDHTVRAGWSGKRFLASSVYAGLGKLDRFDSPQDIDRQASRNICRLARQLLKAGFQANTVLRWATMSGQCLLFSLETHAKS